MEQLEQCQIRISVGSLELPARFGLSRCDESDLFGELEAARRGPHGMTVVPGSADLDAFARADPEGLHDVLSAPVSAKTELYCVVDTCD